MTKTRKLDHTKQTLSEIQMATTVLDLSKAKPIGNLKPAQYDILDADLDIVRKGQRISLEGWTRYCKDCKEFGMTGKETLEYGFARISGFVSKTTMYEWAHKTLPDDAFKVTKPKSNTTMIPESESSKSERSLPQKQLERKQEEEGRPGRTNQDPLEYKIEEIEQYDIDYLRLAIKALHKLRLEFIDYAFKWQTKYDDMQRENKALKEENNRLKGAAGGV